MTALRVVLDCNVVVSTALGSHACAEAVIKALEENSVFLSAAILAEYRRVAAYPKLAKRRAPLLALIDRLETFGILVLPRESGVVLPDPADVAYLDAALAVAPAVLVTGNGKHFPDRRYGEVLVISPREFLDL